MLDRWNAHPIHAVGWGFGGMLEGLSFLVLLGLLVLVGVLLLRSRPPQPSQPPDEALQTARLRYARGEITAEELEEISRNLRRS